jgi:NAD(P)H dehydrogenase (quinone)
MSQTISKALIVLASPDFQSDQRAQLPRTFSKVILDQLQQKGVIVDVIDLYQDTEFDPIWYPENRHTKSIEYQIRIKKSDLIIFVHPVWWLSVPAIMKGFLEKVLVSGFAFKPQKPIPTGLLKDKKMWVLAFSDRPAWEYKMIQRDIVKLFWKRGIADQTGMDLTVFNHYGNTREADIKTVKSWETKLAKLCKKINSKDSILDLL